MDIPSRRIRKQSGPKRTICGIIFTLILLIGICFIVYVAICTGNYMGLAVTIVFAFFLLLGFNIGNMRRLMPGLCSRKKEFRLAAVFIYTCLGFIALTMASYLPNSNEYLPLEINKVSIPQQISQEESSSAVNIDNESVNNLVQIDSDNASIQASRQQENIKQSMPITKMEPAANKTLVTKTLNAQLIEINGQQLIRLVGIQVPDSMQKQATSLVEEMLNNQQVTLTICSERPKDEYGRTRAVVIVNGVNVNLKLIEQGYSPLVMTSPCSIDLEGWRSTEDLAKKLNRGIWKKHPQ